MRCDMKKCVFLFLAIAVGVPVHSQIPRTLSYQGLLTDSLGTPFPDGPYSITFKLYPTSSGGSASWQEGKLVQVTRSVFSTTLGDAVPITLPFDIQYWLGVQVGTDPELTPRVSLSSVGYSMRAINADSASMTELADSARIAGMVPDNAVTTSKILDGSVTQSKLAGGVTLPPGGTAGGDLTGSFPNPTIANATITSAKILDGTIAAADLSNNAVTSAKLANASVTPLKVSSSGAQNGQALTYNGATVAWGNPTGTLTLPYADSSSADMSSVLRIVNTSLSASSPTYGVHGLANSTWGFGVVGEATSASGNSSGVVGVTTAPTGYGVAGDAIATNGENVGVRGLSQSPDGTGVLGHVNGAIGSGEGVFGSTGLNSGRGVLGASYSTSGINTGVYGFSWSSEGIGIRGLATATTGKNYGAYAISSSDSGTGVFGSTTAVSGPSIGVHGVSNSASGRGVVGQATRTTGVNWGVYGSTASSIGYGVAGYATATTGLSVGVYGSSTASLGYAGFFQGNTHVNGTLSKSAGSFKIDHPLDPGNKYLSHSFVESPDMMNVYNGNVFLDGHGEAWIELPNWFEALNKDFRYQLTCIGVFAPVFIEEKIRSNRFKVSGGTSGLEVSWQVTGIRKDAFAEKNRILVEEMKPPELAGKYLTPDVFGKPETMGILFRESHTPNVPSIDDSKERQPRSAPIQQQKNRPNR